MAAQIRQNINSREKLVDALFSDFKKLPTKKDLPAYMSIEAVKILDMMRSRASLIMVGKKASRNDILEKLAEYTLTPGSPGYLSAITVANFVRESSANKTVCFNIPIKIHDLIEETRTTYSRKTSVEMPRSHLIEAMVVLAAVSSRK